MNGSGELILSQDKSSRIVTDPAERQKWLETALTRIQIAQLDHSNAVDPVLKKFLQPQNIIES